jgi:hypothetical protein
LLNSQGFPKRTQHVEQNRSFTLDPGEDRITAIPLRPDDFASAPELAVPDLRLSPGYRDAVLRSGPRGYWRFEALADGAVPNEVPDGSPLLVHGPIELSKGERGNGTAVFKPGAPQQFLTMEPLWELPTEPGHAVELWFLSERIHYASLVGVYPPEDSVSEDFRFLHVLLLEILAFPNPSLDKPASVRFLRRWLHDHYVDNNLFTRNVYVPKRWHHVVAQRDGNRMDLYLDGVRDTSTIIERDPPNLRCRLVLGRRTTDKLDLPKDSRSFVGRLDEIAIYDHPLSPEEVRSHFRQSGETLSAPP